MGANNSLDGPDCTEIFSFVESFFREDRGAADEPTLWHALNLACPLRAAGDPQLLSYPNKVAGGAHIVGLGELFSGDTPVTGGDTSQRVAFADDVDVHLAVGIVGFMELERRLDQTSLNTSFLVVRLEQFREGDDIAGFGPFSGAEARVQVSKRAKPTIVAFDLTKANRELPE